MPSPASSFAATTDDRRRQTAGGVTLSVALIAAWLALHVFTLWFLNAPAHPVIALLCLIGLTWLSVGLFIIAHDAMHGAIAPGRPQINRAFGTVALALYAGFSFRRMIVQHMRHHRAPGTDDDPDFGQGGPVRWYASFVLHYFGWREFWVLGTATIVYALLLWDRWPYVLFWAVPSILASIQLFVFGTWLPHRQEEGSPFVDAHNARSPAMSDAVSLLTCYHFGGYHHEHHLYPGVPWWRLPATRMASKDAA